MTGKTISHYHIIEKLGEGGMGEVYLAEDTKLKRKVALKFISQEITANKEATQRFEQEAQAAAGLNHPNIVTIYEVGEFENQTYISMEYVEGESLREKIPDSPLSIHQKDGGRSVDNIIDITILICEGLSKAHKARISHRDIKPENILIDEDGRVKIVDFGLATLKGSGKEERETLTSGTVYYMSPEQVQGAPVNHQTDIWSLGVVLYEMIAGKRPFEGDFDQVIIYDIINQEPDPIAFGESKHQDELMELNKIVKKALTKKPEDRYQHIEKMLDDLKSIRDTELLKEKNQQKLKKRTNVYRLVLGFIIILLACIYITQY